MTQKDRIRIRNATLVRGNPKSRGFHQVIGSLRVPFLTRKNFLHAACVLPSLDVVAVFKAPSPEPNPDSPLPVKTTVSVYITLLGSLSF